MVGKPSFEQKQYLCPLREIARTTRLSETHPAAGTDANSQAADYHHHHSPNERSREINTHLRRHTGEESSPIFELPPDRELSSMARLCIMYHTIVFKRGVKQGTQHRKGTVWKVERTGSPESIPPWHMECEESTEIIPQCFAFVVIGIRHAKLNCAFSRDKYYRSHSHSLSLSHCALSHFDMFSS